MPVSTLSHTAPSGDGTGGTASAVSRTQPTGHSTSASGFPPSVSAPVTSASP